MCALGSVREIRAPSTTEPDVRTHPPWYSPLSWALTLTFACQALAMARALARALSVPSGRVGFFADAGQLPWLFFIILGGKRKMHERVEVCVEA